MRTERARQAEGDKLRRSWTQSLARACGYEPAPSDFLGIVETEVLKGSFFAAVKSLGAGRGFRGYWPLSESGAVASVLEDIARQTSVRHGIVFSDKDVYLGAVRLPVTAILNHAWSVWRVVGEDLTFASADLSDGLCVEINYYADRGQYVPEGVYELSAWGRLMPGGGGQDRRKN
jgi:hypothetical protein